MVWNVDRIPDNGNETRPSDPSLRRPQLHQEGMASPVGDVAREETPVDVKQENIRKIQQVVQQIEADIKYCAVRRERMLEDRSNLQDSINRLEEALTINDMNQNALSNARHALMAAMDRLEPETTTEDKPAPRMHIEYPEDPMSGVAMASGPSNPSMRY